MTDIDDEINIMATSEWPIETTNLQKGDVIDITRVEQILRLQRGTSAYALESLRLITYIRTRLWERGLHAVVVSRKGAIAILTDSEALEYNQSLHEQGLRRAQRAHVFQSRVDVTGLSPDEVIELDRSLTVMGATLAAMGRARNEARRVTATRREDRPAIQQTPLAP